MTPGTLTAACPLFLGLTWDSGTFLFLLVNAVKLLNEK